MTAAALIPYGITDDWRARALAFVQAWYARHFPELPVIIGGCSGDWSKGAAIADAYSRLNPSVDVIILADADSFLPTPATLTTAVDLVARRRHPYVIPHRHVYRLRDKETDRLHADPETRPRLGVTVRPIYEGPEGGGITVLARSAYETVGGVDPRFEGWGGEDVALGWALQTLVGNGERLDGKLVHLWHPHPAPDLRGSPESEALVDRYRKARQLPHRMRAVVAGEPWTPRPPLEQPVRFRMTANRTCLRLATGDRIQFRNRLYETRDPDEADLIRLARNVREERVR